MTPAPPARRVFAKGIDIVFTWALMVAVTALLTSRLGAHSSAVRWGAVMVGYLWFLCADGFTSPGKLMLGLRCVDASTGRDCSLGQSLLRNLIFVPDFGRALVKAWAGPGDAARAEWLGLVGTLSVFGLVLVIAEIRWMAGREDKRRLGDAMGDTRVVLRAG